MNTKITDCIRCDFPLLIQTNEAYLDNAATSQKPYCVIKAVEDFYKHSNANPLRGLYELSVNATDRYENAREAVRKFIHAKESAEIVFTRNATESLNLIAYSSIFCLGRWLLAAQVRNWSIWNVSRTDASRTRRLIRRSQRRPVLWPWVKCPM